jgi:hypothetical protein
MSELSQSTVTYSGGGQTTSPVSSATLSPSLATLAMGGTRVFAIYAAYQQLQSLKQNLTIAKNYYNTNKQDFDFWNTTYNPKMLVALNEGMTRPYYTNSNFTPQYGALDYTASVGRGQSRASLKTDKEWFQTRRRIGKYNVGQGHRIDLKYALARLNSEFEGWNLGFRYEDNRKMVYDEQRHAHQAEILNLGIGSGNAARAGLSTAVQGLSEAKAQRAGTLGSLSNGLSTFAGYAQQTQDIRQTAQAKRAFAGSQTGGQLSTATPSNDKIFSSGF